MTWFSDRSGMASIGTRVTATAPHAHSARKAATTTNRLCSDQRMRWLIMAGTSFDLVAAVGHRRAEERIVDRRVAREPAAGAEHGRHRAFEDVQALAVIDVRFAGEIRHGGAERFEGAAGRAEIRAVDEGATE